MIWLVWRRHRFALLGLSLFALFLVAELIWSGWTTRAGYYRISHGQSAASCAASQSSSALCAQLTITFRDTYEDPPDLLGWLGILLAPPLAGVFFGAPLVAGEIEQGTQRLAWTQGVTRHWWLASQLVAPLLIALALLALVEAAVWYWNGPYELLGPLASFGNFDTFGVAPLAYMSFALALGMALGALTRRIVPAMLLTLVSYLAARISIAYFVRPYYLPPLTLTWDPYVTRVQAGQPGGADWLLSSGWIDAGGYPVNRGGGLLGPRPGGPPGCDASQPFLHTITANVWNGWDTLCTHNSGWHYQDIWQPASRFWPFQGIESVIFLALAVALVLLTLRLVRGVAA